MPDLRTTYLGLPLRSPLVASASPLSKRIDTVEHLADAGVGAIVLYSLFEEQIIFDSLQLDQSLSFGTDSFPEALSYLPDMGTYGVGPESYLTHMSQIKQAVDIPVIASLNGITAGGWIDYARKLEEAGAAAIELNIYNLPVDPHITAAEIEEAYISLVEEIRGQIAIPLAVKLSPFFTALPHFSRRLVEAGANGLVLFNRFYQPDFDLESLTVVPRLVLSDSDELRLPLRWVALLYGAIKADMAITSGVHTSADLIKAVMAGANVAMMASALLKHGPEHARTVLTEVEAWMSEREYESIEQMRGSMSQRNSGDPIGIERSNYIRTLGSYDTGRRAAAYTAIAEHHHYPPLESPDISDEYYSG